MKNKILKLLPVLLLVLTSCGPNNNNNNGGNGDGVVDANLSPYEIFVKYNPTYIKDEDAWEQDVLSNNVNLVFSSLARYYHQDNLYHYEIVRSHETFTKPIDPKIENAEFISWYDEVEKKWDFDNIASKSIDLHSKFYADIKMYDGDTLVKTIRDNVGKEVNLPPLEDKDGFKFVGWTLKDSNDVLPQLFPLEHHVSVYAKWDKTLSLNEYDPYYPIGPTDKDYTMNVPSLDNRLVLSKDDTSVTLFAPGVSKDSNYYDANKTFNGDNHLCWAAACSNIIAWYLDRADEQGVHLLNVKRNVNEIFLQFKNNWSYLEGYDPAQGFAWYFTGKVMSGGKPDNLLNEKSGGYLAHLPFVGDVWSILDPYNPSSIFGNYEFQYPFMDDNLRMDETIDSFSKNIIGQLHYGPSACMITKKGASTLSSHAITLWGCDYDIASGRVTKIYVTDSDDGDYHYGRYLKEVKIKESSDDYHGVEMIDYYLPRGEATPFTYLGAATNFFDPSVAKLK